MSDQKKNVAIKDVRVSQGSSSSFLRKEGQILKTLNHLNIVNLVSLWNCGSGDNECPALVLELCFCNLTYLLRQHGGILRLGHVKCLALDLMEGLRYIHSRRVILRDIKPDNILLTGNGLLKICNFGLVTFIRENHDGRCYSPGVGSKSYMAPELLLESTRYNWAVDIWAVGCTIAELISCEHFFGGSSKEEMLAQMIILLGTIDRTTLPQRLDLPLLDHHTLPRNNEPRMDYELTLTTSDNAARSLLKNLLQLNPDSRLSASDALAHDFFLCDPRPERFILVVDSTDQHGVQVSSSASTVAPSSLQVEACHDVSASTIAPSSLQVEACHDVSASTVAPSSLQVEACHDTSTSTVAPSSLQFEASTIAPSSLQVEAYHDVSTSTVAPSSLQVEACHDVSASTVATSSLQVETCHDTSKSTVAPSSLQVEACHDTSTSTVAPSSLQVEACHNVSASDNSVGERILQDISPAALQNNNEAGNEFNPICILSESESANFDTNLMLHYYHQDSLSASDVISSDMDVQVQHVPPPSGFPSTARADTVQPQSQSMPHPSGFPATARDDNNNTTQPQPQAASHAPELLSTAEINPIRRQSQLLPPPGYLQPQIPYQQMSHVAQGSNMAFATQLRQHQLTHPGHLPGVSGVSNHQPNYPYHYQQQHQNPQHTMQPGGHFHGPYFCDKVNHNTRPY